MNKKEPKKYEDPSQSRKKQFKSEKLNAEDAERVLAELKNKERELQGKLKKQKGAANTNGKDW